MRKINNGLDAFAAAATAAPEATCLPFSFVMLHALGLLISSTCWLKGTWQFHHTELPGRRIAWTMKRL